jgi:iron(III) transport system substrate-binding protein
MIAQAKEEGELVIVGSHGEWFGTRLPGFQEKYPFIKIGGMDMNTVKTVNRAMMEVGAGRVTMDIFETSDDGGFSLAGEALQKPGAEYPHLKDFAPRLQPSSGLFVSITLTPRPQGAYHADFVSPDEVPTTWEEMTDPRWKGRTIVSASAEEMPARLAYLWRKGGEMDWDRSFAFWEKLFQQEPLIGPGFQRGNEQLAAGERAAFWFTVGGPVIQKHLEGAPVELIAFPPFISGFRSVGIIKGAPHPAAAWLLIDYLTSPEGQLEYTEQVGVLPLNSKAETGLYGRLMMEAGATFDGSEASSSDYTLDAMAAKVYTPEATKKSEDFFLERMGVR